MAIIRFTFYPLALFDLYFRQPSGLIINFKCDKLVYLKKLEEIWFWTDSLCSLKTENSLQKFEVT